MTLSTTAARTSAAGNGVTTSFAFAFKIWAASNLKVYLRDNTTLADTLQTLSTDYTVDIVSFPNTGNVVFNVAPASGKTVVIVRDMPLVQELDLIASGAFPAESVELQLDKLAAEIQTLRDMISRAPLLPVGTTLLDKTVPNLNDPAVAAGSLLGVNAGKDGWSFYANELTGLAASSFFATLADDANAAAFFATLGIKTGSATVDFASVADNATSAGSNITVTGAAVGDFVFLAASGDIMTTAGVFLHGKVTASNTVTAYLHNDSGGAFDAASQTVYALVLPKSIFGL